MSKSPYSPIPSIHGLDTPLARILQPMKHDLDVLLGFVGDNAALTGQDIASGRVVGKQALAEVKQRTGLDALTQADIQSGKVLDKQDKAELVKALSDLAGRVDDIRAVNNALTWADVDAGTILDNGDKTELLDTIDQKTATFIFDQPTAAATWTIKHNLGKWPVASVVDSAKQVVVGTVDYLDNNTIVINFTAAMAGQAFLN
jgi:hypothetical protein